jgi:hypothetical protein
MNQRHEKPRAVLTVGVFADLIEVQDGQKTGFAKNAKTARMRWSHLGRASRPNPFPFPGIARLDINMDPP